MQLNFGVYIHIPFCTKRCFYCDFYTQGGHKCVPDAYIDALLCCLEQHRKRLEDGTAKRPNTLYFGGGTPGLLSKEQVQRLIKAVNPLPTAEITMELNPETTDGFFLEELLQAGVNRVSFGVQTARDESLLRLGRRHTAKEAARALKVAREAGFQNISGDLMVALPQYSEAELHESLQLLQEGGVCHISMYLLKIEGGTPFGKHPPQGLPSDDEAADFYLLASQLLQEKGFARYEISNFAKENCESRHNLLYWNCEDYLGLGPAAHSCLNGRRFSFAPDIQRFMKGDFSVQEEGVLTAEDYLMLRLRTEKGISESEWRKRFGGCLSEGQKDTLKWFEKKRLCKKTQEGWALTSEGFLVQNSILTELLEEL